MMWVDMNTITPELEKAIYAYPWPVVRRFGETTISIRSFAPGTYYLCTDSGELTSELPDVPHHEIVLQSPALCLGIADEVWQKYCIAFIFRKPRRRFNVYLGIIRAGVGNSID